MSFNFGAPKTSTTTSGAGGTGMFGSQPAAPASGFTFGGTPTASGGATSGASTGTGFPFGSTPASTQPTAGGGFPGFGGTPGSTQPASSGGFTGFGATPVATSTTASGFALGGSTATSTPGFGLGAAKTTASTGGTGFSFSAPGMAPNLSLTGGPSTAASTAPAPATGNNLLSGLLTAPTTTAAPTSGFNLGQLSAPGTAAPTGSTGFKLGGNTAATTAPAATGFSLGGASAPKLGTSTAATTAAPSLGGLAANTGLGGSGQGAPASTAAAPGASFGFGAPATATTTKPAAVGFGGLTGLGTPSTAKSTTTTSAVPSQQMNYKQLEDQINKWMTELEEQERLFLTQATQVNAWDRLLVDNGEKITTLNSDMERVKVDQGRLEQELEFIKSQQRELEELLVPMEKSLDSVPSSSLQPHADLEREHTYQLADNIDAQLKRMVQDLKEIIDHLNTSSSNQDNSDPILQITKILNAHMDSLQWIDTNSAMLTRRVEDISKQMESQRKDQERNFRLVYD